MSRQLHPDFFHNAPTSERLASLERTSYLNDAYRTLRDPVRRAEYLLSLEGMPAATGESSEHAKVPPALLEEVFALNENLDDIREMREAGADAAELRTRVEAAREPIEQKRRAHEQQLDDLGAAWDGLGDDATPEERRDTLERLREVLFERKYISNLLATIDREVKLIHG
jgi:molecular chaperone HscB